MASTLWDSGLISQSSTTISFSTEIPFPGNYRFGRLWGKNEGLVGGSLSQTVSIQFKDPFGGWSPVSGLLTMVSTGATISKRFSTPAEGPDPTIPVPVTNTIRFKIEGAGANRYKFLVDTNMVEVVNPTTSVRVTNSTSQRVPTRTIVEV